MHSLIILVTVVFLPWQTLASECAHDATNFRCVQFRDNYDGDTIRVDVKNVHPIIGDNIRVRIRGIDTAEMEPRHKCKRKKPNDCQKQKVCERKLARLARDELKQALQKAKRIDLVNVERGNYFRLLADLHLDGKSVEPWLIKSGLAVKYRKKQRGRIDWCKQAGKFERYQQAAARKKQ